MNVFEAWGRGRNENLSQNGAAFSCTRYCRCLNSWGQRGMCKRPNLYELVPLLLRILGFWDTGGRWTTDHLILAGPVSLRCTRGGSAHVGSAGLKQPKKHVCPVRRHIKIGFALSLKINEARHSEVHDNYFAHPCCWNSARWGPVVRVLHKDWRLQAHRFLERQDEPASMYVSVVFLAPSVERLGNLLS